MIDLGTILFLVILYFVFKALAGAVGSGMSAGGEALGNLLYNLSRLPRNIRLGYTGEWEKLGPWERLYGKFPPPKPPAPRVPYTPPLTRAEFEEWVKMGCP